MKKNKEDIHILMLAPLFLPFRGAVSSRLESFARYWSKLVRVTVISAYPGEEKEKGYSLVRFPLARWRFEPLKIVITHSKLHSLVKDINPDVIFASIPPVWPLLEGYAISRSLGYPLILDVRDLPTSTYPKNEGSFVRDIFNFFMRSLSKYLIPKSTKIVVVTNSLSVGLNRIISLASHEIVVIRNGSDLGDFKEAISTKKEYDLIYSGSLIKTRDPQSIHKYLRYLADLYPSLRVLFLSDINSTSVGLKFMQGLEALNLANNVVVREMVPHNMIGRVLSSSRLGLDSHRSGIYSERGAISAKDYEYLAAGLPIVGLLDPHYYIETRRLILDNEVGILDSDSKSLAIQTAALLNDHQRLRKMSQNARVISALFDRKKLAEDCFYNAILPAWREFNVKQ